MKKLTGEIIKYYSKYDEHVRLSKDPAHEIEFLITMHFIEKHLPKKGSILDVGGGTGKYAFELAKKGYDVVLIDVVPNHVDIANLIIKQKKLENKVVAFVGDVTNLKEFKNAKFDAVLCLGAVLSHVTYENDIDLAMKELVRVAKKDAPIFVSVIGRLGAAQYRLRYENKRIINYFTTLKTGFNSPGKTGGFTDAHFFLGKELENLFLLNKLKIVDKVGLEGLSSGFQEETNFIYKNKKIWNAWIEMLKETANDETAYGKSLHFMIIGKK
ncbi:MAG: class I SAM-dependent methyltransferase [Candidatus Woesearchaeota archaeon]|jgi:ubiquinone/menaquinone biosynthesis C-methylase UbiE